MVRCKEHISASVICPMMHPTAEKEKIGFKEGQGVFVREVAKDGAASTSGLKSGDYITKVNGVKVVTGSEMVEQVAGYKPGDKVSLSYLREGKEYTTTLTLKNRTGNYDVVKNTNVDKLGAEFENVDKKTVAEFGYEGGVKIKNLNNEGMLSDQNPSLKKGFIIVKVSGKPVKNIDEFSRALDMAGNSATLEGFYPGSENVYVYGLNDLQK